VSRRQPRARAPRGRSLVGERYDVDVGPVAHGGHCVARLPAELPEVGGTVVFVRHTLPGERVTVQVTEGSVGERFLRGDAVEVQRESEDRVARPCPYAGPGLCGGCDFQHVRLEAQRRLKADVVAEQLRRLAGLDRPVEVEAVPGDSDGLRWRSRMRYSRTPDGGLGLRAHRSRDLVPIGDCRIQAPDARVTVEGETGAAAVQESVGDHRFVVDAAGFWQVHRGAPSVLVRAVLEGASVRPGDRVTDLYAGVGLFTAFLAEAVGPSGHVRAVEGELSAYEHAVTNVADYEWAEVVHGDVERVLSEGERGGSDVVVLDPPRTGARRGVVQAIAAQGPRTVVYVACDPAAFARDVSYFAESGYDLSGLRAFDLFPMTHHVELVGVLSRMP
jgi:tRNA/tmRNA/rRNA uracil-C5-methylase (TrmA/RlmC/RlmD family)